MGLKELKKKLEENDKVFTYKLVLTFVVAVVSMVLAIVALVQLQTVASDVTDVLDNWETKPVVEIATVEHGESCPEGFEEEKFRELSLQSFPGVKHGHCVCPPEAVAQLIFSTYDSCDSADGKTTQQDAGCKNVPAIDKKGFKTWRGAKLCFRRGGEPQVTFDPKYKRRPRPELEGGEYVCPEGYQLCGSGSYAENYAICFPEHEPCPYTGLIISDSPPAGDGFQEINGTSLSGGFKLYGRREHPGELPVVDLKIALTDVKVGYDREDLEDYSGSDNDRGPCYDGQSQRFSSPFSYNDATSIVDDIKPSYPGKCRTVDRRYKLFDFIAQEDLMLETFQLADECENSDLKSLTDPTFLAANDPDYHQSGIACDPGSPTIDLRCSFEPGFACAAGDVICETTTSQTRCGALAHVAHEVSAESTTWGWYGRGEIIWADECVPQIKPLEQSHEPLKATVAAQTAAVVISCIANTILGIIFPLIAYHERFGDKEKKCSTINCCSCLCCTCWAHGSVDVCRKRWGMVLKLSKVITLIVVIAHLARIRDFYALLGDKNCSDGLTNHTFDYLGEELPKIFATSIANLVLDGAILLGSLAMAIWAWRKKMAVVHTDVEGTELKGNAIESGDSSHGNDGSPQPVVVVAPSRPVYVTSVATVAPAPQEEQPPEQPQAPQSEQPQQPANLLVLQKPSDPYARLLHL